MGLRVALNALFLHYPYSGTGRYLDNLIAFSRQSVDLTLVGSRAFPPTTADFAASACRLWRTPFDRGPRPLAKVWFEQIALPRIARRLDVDVVHNPYFTSSLFPGRATVVTVHDLVPLVRSEYRRTVAQRLYTALVATGLKSARAIITDSEASGRDLRARLAIPAERIRVIPLAVDTRFRPLETDEEKAWARGVLDRLGIDRPFVVYLGGLDRRKNVDALVRSFARLKRQRGLSRLLVIVGALREGDDLFYDPRPDVSRLDLGDSVRLLGRIDDADVRALHASSDAFVFPSLYEGFGLPPLEAMACGAPVVCSNASSLPEVVGDAGVLFDPTCDEDLDGAIEKVLSDADLRWDLSVRGRERAVQFTWEKTVRSTMEVWEEVGSGRR